MIFSKQLLLTELVLCAITALALSVRGQATNSLPAIELRVAFPNLKVNRPLWLEEAPDGSKRLFLIEQAGRILIVPKDRNGKETKVFLDIVNRKPFVKNEEGLLAMAFHPQFKSNGKFYVYYSRHEPKRNRLSEFRAARGNRNKADLASERVLMETTQPYWNHDGATLLFGPDGFLYLSLGDGGLANDPHNVGQSLHFVLGKILRLDVDARTGDLPYAIPKDNPFVAREKDGSLKANPFDTQDDGVRPEIWAYGLRNVWRMSFDRETGALWAGDVGQDKWEEVDLIVKGGNYGWNVREGFHPFKESTQKSKFIDPVIEYPHNPTLAKESKFPEHSHGTSITGGYVYRGKKMPRLRGVYLYADFTLGTIWGLRYENGQVTASGTLAKSNPSRQIASFAEDRDGEIYVLAFDGKIYELAEARE
ncbi:MAG: PQQ-dependent sugar dehydrogenase [Verrucomicrobia bacterium]|nr:PQQ-dependent sugar dehydrogenase [Verrucomicrobiota bacterium]